MLSYREEFILYGLRKLGHPVVEVNIADEQIEECIMDTTSYFQNRHMDGVEKMYLKYKIEKNFIDRIGGRNEDNTVGIVTTTGREHTIAGIGSTVVSSFEEDQNFLMNA